MVLAERSWSKPYLAACQAGLHTRRPLRGSHTCPMAQRVKWQMVLIASDSMASLSSAAPMVRSMNSKKRRSYSACIAWLRSRTSATANSGLPQVSRSSEKSQAPQISLWLSRRTQRRSTCERSIPWPKTVPSAPPARVTSSG